MSKRKQLNEWFLDILCAIGAGIVVGTAYYFFQNSNGFAPGGVGGDDTRVYVKLL